MIDKTVVIVTILIGAFDSAGQPIHAIDGSIEHSAQSGLRR